ncbi:MAG: Na/Pi cotransporter family protein [Bacilli bacterium]|nr:Na/Pi cotransporter family protein [Bacilli bacterium]
MEIVSSLLKMLGGLALLIYGMKMLSSNLKKLTGGKLEQILVNATNNPVKGLIVGFLITVMTQSSATTTVLVVGLVNSEILTLKNAIPIIMGANIGTTVNSQILRLTSINGSSWLGLLSPASFAPVLLIVSLLIHQKAKKKKTRDIASMIMGLGILFTGMVTMVSMASSFKDLPILTTILQDLSNPFLGVLAGALVTAIVQSSSATVGILQALSTTGKIRYATTIPIILGQNIGTCFTSILASLSGSSNAKRVAMVHLYFNLIGTILFLAGIYGYQHFVGFSFWNSVVDMGGIANFHMIFNVVSTIILFPFMGLIEKLTMITIRDKNVKDELDESLMVLNKLDDRVSTMPRIAIDNSKDVVMKMGELSASNFDRSMKLLKSYSEDELLKVEKCENNIDKMEEVVTRYLVNLENLDLSERENKKITYLLRIEAEYEKIGDYAFRLSKKFENINDNEITFSKSALKELDTMYAITKTAIKKTMSVFDVKKNSVSVEVEALRDFAEVKKEKFKSAHIRRLKKGKCSVESGLSFLEILNCCESIINHCLNISISLSNYAVNKNIVTKHDYRNMMYNKYSDEIEKYIKKYEKEFN